MLRKGIKQRAFKRFDTVYPYYACKTVVERENDKVYKYTPTAATL